MINEDDYKIENICIELQPYYKEYISKYSKSYLSGMSIYVGDNLLEWWNKSNNVRFNSYLKNIQQLKDILEVLLIYNNKI